MSLLYKISGKEFLEKRNEIFKKYGIPALKENGFVRSPFLGIWFGKDNLGDYAYELCRLSKDSQLEIISVFISTGDKWIKIYLNIFKLDPEPKSLEELKGVDGLKFHLPPNSLSRMRLRIDDHAGMPLTRRHEHKVRFYYSRNSLERSLEDLGHLIAADLSNIQDFIKKWLAMHQLKTTTWEGEMIS